MTSPSNSRPSFKIPIQSNGIEVSKDRPFNEDLLNRKESVQILTDLINKIQENGVIAIDAPWGNGKTTFLKILHEYLLKNNFPVVNLNAWENEFSDDPFTCLSEELLEGLEKLEFYPRQKRDIIESIKEHVKEIRFTINPTPITSLTIVTGKQSRPNNYKENKEKLTKFKKYLEDLSEDSQIIVMIDELDRCRPLYAVKFLESIKHFFLSNKVNIIFIIAINRAQLVHSIRALYGEEFDAYVYLKRFINIDFQLPYPKLDDLIDKLVESIDLKGSLYEINNDDKNLLNIENTLSEVKELLIAYFSYSELSLRQIEQSIYRLGLAFKSLRQTSPAFIIPAIVATLLRAVDESLYYKFYYGEITDSYLVNKLFNNFTNKKKIKHIEKFEAAIIQGYCEIARKDSPLEKEYTESVNNSNLTREEQTYAQNLLNALSKVREKIGEMSYFKESCKRIELLSDHLTPFPDQ